MPTAKQVHKFIVVSNRLPVSVTKENGRLVFTPSSGGLATAMSSLGRDTEDRLWIGWPGISSDELTAQDKAVITKKLQQYGCYPVFLSQDQVQNFYEGYCNDTIWPMFHYFQSVAQFNSDYWQAYRQVNELYSKAILKKAARDSDIWVHDYHLLLLPKMLRKTLKQSTIGLFLHIPFPSYEIFRLIPERRELLEGMLGADLLGFHTYDYARHFLSSCLRLLGLESTHGTIRLPNRNVVADAFPIGIDYQKFKTAVTDPSTRDEIKVLNEHYDKQKIILSVDRLDYSKGIMKRLEAYESFLQQHPTYHKKVALVVVAVPSRVEVEAYKDLRDTVEQAVSRINGTYGTVDWTPISYQFKNLPFEQLVALYHRAEIALVTPLRDGMNLVAKEFVAAKQKNPGVLILSEMAGAVDEMPEALRINPNNTDSIVEAIRTALKMPKAEQKRRLASIQRRLEQYTVQRWGADFIEQMEQTKNSRLNAKNTDCQTLIDTVKRSYLEARSKLIVLDYDGTLHKLVSSPQPAKSAPSKSLLNLLGQLNRQAGTKVCIVSGRPHDVLDKWFKGLDITLAAEHGAWLRDGGKWENLPLDFEVHKNNLLPILNRYAERTPGALVEEKHFALVWHYRNVATELAYARNSSLKHELNLVLADTDLEMHNGHKIIEIKPRSVSKGAVISRILTDYPADFVLTIGDDYTDESMFETAPVNSFTVKVGPGDTHARYRVADVPSVVKLLNSFV